MRQNTDFSLRGLRRISSVPIMCLYPYAVNSLVASYLFIRSASVSAGTPTIPMVRLKKISGISSCASAVKTAPNSIAKAKKNRFMSLKIQIQKHFSISQRQDRITACAIIIVQVVDGENCNSRLLLDDSPDCRHKPLLYARAYRPEATADSADA